VPENVRANIETLKKIGVKISADNLYKLRKIICSDETEEIKSNISILKEI
jgi:biotin operon repressor